MALKMDAELRSGGSDAPSYQDCKRKWSTIIDHGTVLWGEYEKLKREAARRSAASGSHLHASGLHSQAGSSHSQAGSSHSHAGGSHLHASSSHPDANGDDAPPPPYSFTSHPGSQFYPRDLFELLERELGVYDDQV